MTVKQRYNARRFKARRFKAAKWKGGGPNAPDFMHGILRIVASLSGEVKVEPTVRGTIGVNQ